ncbi:uncharacterized protein LOC111076383 isoform X2 [Drosophila obscura]|nr:uncharacterized protein LOC111076383 isoform X2 [Drosophila obscura]
MAPETIGKLMRMMQDYVFQMQLLNHQYKWFRNGQDQGDLVGLLGQQDELLKLLRGTFRDSDSLFIRCLLTALLDLDLFVVFGKGTLNRKRSSMIRGISELYAGVAGPQKPHRPPCKGVAKKIVNPPWFSAYKTADPETSNRSVVELTTSKPSRHNHSYLATELRKLFKEHLDTKRAPSETCSVLPKSSVSKGFILPTQ